MDVAAPALEEPPDSKPTRLADATAVSVSEQCRVSLGYLVIVRKVLSHEFVEESGRVDEETLPGL